MRLAIFLASVFAAFQLGSTFVTLPNKLSRHFSLEASTSTPEQLKQKFGQLKKAFPWNVDPVAAGGWYNLEKLADNPKEDLVNLVVKGLKEGKSKVEFSADDEKLEALVTLLYGMGKGFNADLVNGEWAMVFSKQGRKSPRFQRLVGKRQKAGKGTNVFDISSMTFSGDVRVLKLGLVGSKVKYAPLSNARSKTSDGKIVLRRIGCDIVGASFKFWILPRLPLPLKRTGGFLDFVYMDKDVRVTRGNRGGLFIHFRPEFLEEQLST